MPQELQVLRCYSCETFQVHIVKKIPKWECKICEEKQSIRKVYGRGSGRDCRILVQDLNQKRLKTTHEPSANKTEYELYSPQKTAYKDQLVKVESTSNRWAEFISPATTDSSDIQTEHGDFSSYTFERPIKRSKHKLLNKKPVVIAEESLENETERVNVFSNSLSVKNRWKKCTDTIVEEENHELSSKSKYKKYVHSQLIQKSTAAVNQNLAEEVDTEDAHLSLSNSINSITCVEAQNNKWTQFIAPASLLETENKIHGFQDDDLSTTKLNDLCIYKTYDFCLQPSSSKWKDENNFEKDQPTQNEMHSNGPSKHFEDSSKRINLKKTSNVFSTTENDLDSILTF